MDAKREEREISEPTGNVPVEDGEPRIDKSPGATFGIVSIAYFAIFAVVVLVAALLFRLF